MRALTPIALLLFTATLLPRTAKAGDAQGCVDLKPFPRLEGCVIVECSAKQHDSFEAGDGSGAPSDPNTNSLAYSCPSGNRQKMERDFEVLLRKAGYQNIVEDNADAASPGLTARKNSQWIQWSANSEGDAIGYSLTTASGGTERFKAEVCGQRPVFSSLKQCDVVECASKSEDSVAMRTAQKGTTSLTGSVETVTLACPSVRASQGFSSVEGELKASGFDILFSDLEHPQNGWMTGRAGKRWVELVSAPDGDSVSYALTLVPSAEVLTAAKPEPSPVPVALTMPTPAAVPAPPPAPLPAPVVTAADLTPAIVPALVSSPAATPNSPYQPVFVPPKPILRVPIESTQDRVDSVRGDVVIHMLVDVGEDGAVTKAVVTGRITKDVLKLESAAIDAMSHWRFEPARQDGRVVFCVKIPVEMHFQGRPRRLSDLWKLGVTPQVSGSSP